MSPLRRFLRTPEAAAGAILLAALFAMFEQPASLMFDILTPGEGRP